MKGYESTRANRLLNVEALLTKSDLHMELLAWKLNTEPKRKGWAAV
jgi:hypothetical protein